MRDGPLLAALRRVNFKVNAQINRHEWVGWSFIYTAELTFFSAYRLSNLGDLVQTSTTPDDDSTSTRVWGVLLGIVQDFVVASFLIIALSGFDAAINHSASCYDTAPNGCLDCFTWGIPLGLRLKLVFKRLARLTIFYAACLLSVAVFAMDVVTVRGYRRRYEFGWNADSEELVVVDADGKRTTTGVMVVVLVAQGIIVAVTTIWFDLTRWTPLTLATRWKSRRNQELPSMSIFQPPVNYLVLDPDDYFNSGNNNNLSEFYDCFNRPICGTQAPQPLAILSDDSRDLPTPRWKFVVFGLGLAILFFVGVPLLVLLITSYCPPAVASIALNANLNEPLRAITTLSFVSK